MARNHTMLRRLPRPPPPPLFPLSNYSTTTTTTTTTRKPKPKSPPPPPPSELPFMASYLQEKLSFPKEQALSLATKHFPRLTSPDRPDAVLHFLRHSAGLSPHQTHLFIRCRPSLLTFSVPSNLSPKLHLFRSLNPSDLPSLLTSCASSFGYSASRRLSPSLSLLRSLLRHDDRLVVSALRRFPRLLTSDPTAVLSRNVAHLRLLGFSSPQISDLILKCPLVLTCHPDRLDSASHLARQQLHLAADDPTSFVDAFAMVVSFDREAFSKKVALVKSYGFGDGDLMTLFRRCPNFLRLRDENIEKKLDFFVRTVGWSAAEIMRNTWVLLFSLESRVSRYELVRGLQARGLVPGEYDLMKAFVMSAKKFREEFVDRFRDGDGVGELVQLYLSRAAGSASCEKSTSSPS